MLSQYGALHLITDTDLALKESRALKHYMQARVEALAAAVQPPGSCTSGQGYLTGRSPASLIRMAQGAGLL